MDILHQLYECARPALQGLFSPGIPFHLRWRMVHLSLISSITVGLKCLPWVFSRSYSVHMIPNRHGQNLRCIVFQPPRSTTSAGKLRPLHLAVHGGAFVSGIAENCAAWATEVSRRTGAVVVCSTYRFAPKTVFPGAHDDTDDVVEYLIENAGKLWNADPRLLSVSGLSAGANLAMATAQKEGLRPGEEWSVKASVTFYAPIDLRHKPEEKVKPPGFPTGDPLSFLFPLFDAYAGPAREANITNPRLSPCIASLDILPENMLFVIPTFDILAHEQFMAISRMRSELRPASGRRIETCICEGCFHGWVELPSFAIKEETRTRAFDTSIAFLKDVHAQHGFVWSSD